MESIRNTSEMVKQALIQNERARNSDNYLYYLICKAKLRGAGIDIDTMSFRDVLLKKNELDLPAYETVRRARQKAQSEHPELAGTAETEAMRAIREESFREFVRRCV